MDLPPDAGTGFRQQPAPPEGGVEELEAFLEGLDDEAFDRLAWQALRLPRTDP